MTEHPLTVDFQLSDGAVLPTYATADAAGLDLRTIEPIELAPLQRKLVRTGLKIAVPSGFEGQVRPRSGLALKYGLTLVNSPGTIDSDYRGEIGLIMINLGESAVKLDKGERIAQLVICPVVRAEPVAVDDLTQTERGEKGFGSTGSR